MPPTSEKFLRPIEDVVETLRNAKERGTKCSVLIGAGCSVTADIPTAQGFVELIQKKYPIKYKRADPKTYPICMGELSVSEQRALIAECVDRSRINWGHIALAQLIKEEYVDRVLTTNFDSLVVRACALLGIFPAVYDFASSQNFEADKIPGQAVFYLHGQRTGFVLMNEEKVLKKQAELLAPVFTDAGMGRVWIVVGYSGENDPVFKHLASVRRFDNNLYWVGYRENAPAKHVFDCLLAEEMDKDAYFVKGFDSDSFFVTLAQQLGCFPPDFVSKPFSYLDGLFNQLTEYTLPKTESPIDALKNARSYVQEAIKSIEGESSAILQASSNLLSGEYEKVVDLQPSNVEEIDPKLSESVAWAYVGQGDELYDKALKNTGVEAEKLFHQAAEKYEAASKIKPDMQEALNNWGNSLVEQAKRMQGARAEDLFRQAQEKYEAALKIKPDMQEALNNWGIALVEQAKRMQGARAEDLFRQAQEKYEAASKIKPDMQDALNNWGTALVEQAKRMQGARAEDLFRQAQEKYEAALKINPDASEVLDNMGGMFLFWAQTKDKTEREELYKQAKNFLVKADQITEGYASYNLACICAQQNLEDECREWLKKGKNFGSLPSRQHLEQDTDLDAVKSKKWFIEFLETL